MEYKENQPELAAPVDASLNQDLSRRKFLQTAAAAGMVAATVPITGMALAGQAEHRSRPEDPLENILSRYGSEFGHMNQVG